MSTLQQLETEYANVTRVRIGLIPAADLATLTSLAAKVDAGTSTFAAATQTVIGFATGGTSVAELTYQFFTGATPLIGGLDFLAEPDGPNPNNLNSPYFQSFTVANRFINLAVSVGAYGEGAAPFAAAYGAGTLNDAATKAYTQVFGFAPAAGKIDAILNAVVPNGRGGTYTRADYFAELGKSGVNGVGAKAAMVGFLLDEAVKADLGPYAKGLDAFLADLAPDGIAKGHVNLLDTYGAAPATVAGATITVNHDQSVSLTSSSTALRSTTGDDKVTGAGGLDIGQTIDTGTGADTVTIHGVTLGAITTGDGRDVVTLDSLGGTTTTTATLGHPSVTGAGSISTGAGDDQITLTQPAAQDQGGAGIGSTIDGGAGDDTLTLLGQVALPFHIQGDPLKLSGIEHLVMLGYTSASVTDSSGATVDTAVFNLASADGVLDVTNASTGAGTIAVRNLEANTLIISRDTSAGLLAAFRTNVSSADLFLDHVSDGLHDQFTGESNLTEIADVTDVLRVHVVSDSAVQGLTTMSSKVIFDGMGRFTGTITNNNVSPIPFTVDASASAGVSLTYFASSSNGVFVLSPSADTLNLSLQYQDAFTATLGGGADTVNLLATLQNLAITGQSVTGYATITDFQKGVDHLTLFSDATALPLVSAAGATTLEAALIAVSSHVSANTYARFEFGGDTWIYHQDATVGANTGDGLIRLVGVTGLTTGSGTTTPDIHFG